VLVADAFTHRIRPNAICRRRFTHRIRPNATITAADGNGTRGTSGDGRLATAGQLSYLRGVAVHSADGSFLIADTSNSRIRCVWSNGTIATVAGSNLVGFSGDGGRATAEALNQRYGVAGHTDGAIYIADRGNSRIQRVASNSIIGTVVGNGIADFTGDGGAAIAAALNTPGGLLFLLMAAWSSYNNRIRRVCSGITAFASTGYCN
jgi:hypothetical protein